MAATTMPIIGSMPPLIKLAIIALERASVLPTERSMPPVRMTKVMPKEISALMETWRSRFFKLDGSIKLLFKADITTKSTINPINGPIFLTKAETFICYIPPVARVMIFSWVAWSCGISPAILPSCTTRMRSLMPITSGRSEETMIMATPCAVSSFIKS